MHRNKEIERKRDSFKNYLRSKQFYGGSAESVGEKQKDFIY